MVTKDGNKTQQKRRQERPHYICCQIISFDHIQFNSTLHSTQNKTEQVVDTIDTLLTVGPTICKHCRRRKKFKKFVVIEVLMHTYSKDK